MIMVKFILPLLALPLGEGVTPFVSADSFMGGGHTGIHSSVIYTAGNSIINSVNSPGFDSTLKSPPWPFVIIS